MISKESLAKEHARLLAAIKAHARAADQGYSKRDFSRAAMVATDNKIRRLNDKQQQARIRYRDMLRQFESQGTLQSNPPTGSWLSAKAVRVRTVRGRKVLDIRR